MRTLKVFEISGLTCVIRLDSAEPSLYAAAMFIYIMKKIEKVRFG